MDDKNGENSHSRPASSRDWEEVDLENGERSSNGSTDSKTSRRNSIFSRVSENRRVTLCWEKINVFGIGVEWSCAQCRWVEKSADEGPTHILQDVSGHALPGQLLAIMGGSGAGKTTLLNILTGRIPPSITATGMVTMNAMPLKAEGKKMLSYVQQDDLFIGTLTVREHLVFQAELRMESSTPYADKVRRVEQIMDDLGLKRCANTKIGIPGEVKGASGGERKRLAFASELLTNPMLMFCDEPTSGLDSFTAKSVVAVLKSLAESGKTIVCTIHQPSSETYEYFSQVMLMSRGRGVFLGKPEDAISFFANNGLKCPKNYNPADFFIDKISSVADQSKIEELCENFDNSEYGKVLTSTVVGVSERLEDQSASFNAHPMGIFEYKTCWCTELWILYKRETLGVLREPELTVMRLSQVVVIAVLLSMIFWRQEINQSGIMNLNGFLFLMVTNMTFQNTYALITAFSVNLTVFRREYESGICRVATYYLAKTTADIPLFVVIPTVFTAIVYFSVGLRLETYAFLNVLAVNILVTQIACSFAYMISCVTGDMQRSLAVTPAFTVVMMIFGGFFLKNGTFPKYLLWLKYISWFNFAYELLVLNQWDNVGEIKCGEAYTCIHSGDDVINTMHFDMKNWHFDFMMLIILLFAYRLVGVLALSYNLTYGKREGKLEAQ